MKLSKAIRNGAKQRKHWNNSDLYWMIDWTYNICSTALGTAAEGSGYDTHSPNWLYAQNPSVQKHLAARFPELKQTLKDNTSFEPDQPERTVQDWIFHLEKRRGWSRERIADWLERVHAL